MIDSSELIAERITKMDDGQLVAFAASLDSLGLATLLERLQVERHAREYRSGVGVTVRELAVARLAARGARNSEIAADLCIAVSTVEKHMSSALAKLRLRSRHELHQVFANRMDDGQDNVPGATT